MNTFITICAAPEARGMEIAMKICYETDRLILRISHPKLTLQVKNYYERNKLFLQEMEPERDEEFYTEHFLSNMLKNEFAEARKIQSARFWIFKKGSNEIIGMVGLNNIVMGVFCSCFLSYKSDKEHKNQGIITEAVRKIIDIAFHEIGLHRIEANIMPKNKASLKVVQKNGFINEGLSRKYLKINGVWEDHIHMVLLNETDRYRLNS